jgi:hypothetical protein
MSPATQADCGRSFTDRPTLFVGATLVANSFTASTGRRNRCVDLDMHNFTVEIVGNAERAQAPAASQRIAHVVGRPDTVRLLGHVQRDTFALGQISISD